MYTVVLATHNKGKVREFREMLRPLGWDVFPLNAFPGYVPPPETGATFCENALIKARDAAERLGLPALADDSGLEVEALEGRPGVFSARFAGFGATDEENNRLLLAELERSPAPPPWAARFVCCLAWVEPSGETHTFHGETRGWILAQPRGSGGFGYDPLFWSPELQQTFGEAPPEAKNRVSHRKRALEALVQALSRPGKGAPGASSV
nr:RdgB/HAM1 family non-canonical purine NTP pyrophosphatase [Kyrpidia tusciae]